MAFKDGYGCSTGPQRGALVGDIPCALCGSSFPGHIYMVGRYNICPACRKKLGPEGTEKAVLSIRPDYQVIDGHIIHTLCGKEFRQKTLSPSRFLWDGVECGCLKETGSLRIHKRAFDDGEFTVTDYSYNASGYRTIVVRHEVCGNTFKIKPHDFKKKRYCRICRTHAYGFADRVQAMTGGEYKVIKPPSSLGYRGCDVVLQHMVCGTVFKNRARNILEGQRCPFCCVKPGADEVTRLIEQNCDTDGYTIRPDGMYIHVIFPDGLEKRIRGARALQDLMRYDAPEIFVRIRRIMPPINEKARIFLFYRGEYGVGTPFTTDNGPEKTGVPSGSYFSAMSQLVKQGRLIRIKKGVYKIAEKSQDSDSGNVPAI